MKVAHYAPFSPTGSGLYEAAGDFVRADRMAGREADLIDVGAYVGEGRAERRVGELDSRGGCAIRAMDYSAAADADLLVLHDLPPEVELAKMSAPAVWIMHGRPEACFRNEEANIGKAELYTLVPKLAAWPRVRAMVTMWPEHLPYWRALGVKNLRSLPNPPIDTERYSPEGIGYKIPQGSNGTHNVLIADSWRRDVGIFHALNAAVLAAMEGKGIKFHVYAVEHKKLAPYQNLLDRLEEFGALGEVKARVVSMASVYRSMDAVLTSHSMATRIIGEALCCGIKVVAGADCAYTPWSASKEQPDSVALELIQCLESGVADPGVGESHFGLGTFSGALTTLYSGVLS